MKLHSTGIVNRGRCLRKWDLATRRGWTPKQESSKLWFGSAFHYALRDREAEKRYPCTVQAFNAYLKLRMKQWGDDLPDDLPQLRRLGIGMLEQYERFLENRTNYETAYDSQEKPLVEVRFAIPLQVPVIGTVYVEGAFDRIVYGSDQLVLVQEYKTRSAYDTNFDKSTQYDLYLWAANKLFVNVDGLIVQQHLKKVPDEPRVLKNGSVSRDKRQATTYQLYREVLLDRFDQVPAEYDAFVQQLRGLETTNSDPFVRRSTVRRSEAYLANFEDNLRHQAVDYFNDRQYIYPNPTRDCTWDCDYKVVCDLMNEGLPYDDILRYEFTQSEGEKRVKSQAEEGSRDATEHEVTEQTRTHVSGPTRCTSPSGER